MPDPSFPSLPTHLAPRLAQERLVHVLPLSRSQEAQDEILRPRAVVRDERAWAGERIYIRIRQPALARDPLNPVHPFHHVTIRRLRQVCPRLLALQEAAYRTLLKIERVVRAEHIHTIMPWPEYQAHMREDRAERPHVVLEIAQW